MNCKSRSTLGIVIGWLGIIACAFAIASSICCLVYLNTVQSNLDNVTNDSNPTDSYDPYDPYDIYIDNEDFDGAADEDDKETNKYITDHMNSICIGLIVVCATVGFASALLIQGIKKKRHSLIVPWLVISDIFFVIFCFWTILTLLAGSFWDFIFCTVILGVEAFIIFKIYALYKDIKTRNNDRNGQIISASGVGFTGADHKNVLQNA